MNEINKVEVYTNLYPKLLSFSFKHVYNYHDAYDVLQKVYIFFNNKDVNSFTDMEHVEHWLMWLTKSESMCYNRRNKKYIAIDDEELNNKICEEKNPFEQTVSSDLKEIILKKLPEAFSILPPLQKNAARMYFLEGKDRHYICKALKSTEGAVSSAISKSIKSISKYFQNAGIV